jgi:hypothetical protein
MWVKNYEIDISQELKYDVPSGLLQVDIFGSKNSIDKFINSPRHCQRISNLHIFSMVDGICENMEIWGSFRDIYLSSLIEELYSSYVYANLLDVGFSAQYYYNVPLELYLLNIQKIIDLTEKYSEAKKILLGKFTIDDSNIYRWAHKNYGASTFLDQRARGLGTNGFVFNDTSDLKFFAELSIGSMPVKFWRKLSYDFPDLDFEISFSNEHNYHITTSELLSKYSKIKFIFRNGIARALVHD